MSQELLLEIENLRTKLIKYTKKAFQMLPRINEPQILDIGCGLGTPTIELAKMSNGEIIGIDIDQSSLEILDRRAEKEGFSNRIKTMNLSLFKIDFPDESFDIIWSEGSIIIIGFERGIKEWWRLLKPKGFLVIHDEAKTKLELSRVSSYGYELVESFSLPEDAWWTEFYKPLQKKINNLRKKYESDPEAIKLLQQFQNEIDLIEDNPKIFACQFYLLRKL
jgi:ubiquinone/menaquinone biosynthesis C-methylase UbiE